MQNRNTTNYYRKVGSGYVQHNADKKYVAIYETLHLLFKIIWTPIYLCMVLIYKFFEICLFSKM